MIRRTVKLYSKESRFWNCKNRRLWGQIIFFSVQRRLSNIVKFKAYCFNYSRYGKAFLTSFCLSTERESELNCRIMKTESFLCGKTIWKHLSRFNYFLHTKIFKEKCFLLREYSFLKLIMKFLQCIGYIKYISNRTTWPVSSLRETKKFLRDEFST